MAKLNKKQLSTFDKKLQEAVNLLQQGRSNEALGGLMQMVKIKPNDFRVHDCMCIANSALGRHAEAVESGTLATQLAPQSGEIRHRFAKALQAAGELADWNRVPFAARASMLGDVGRS